MPNITQLIMLLFGMFILIPAKGLYFSNVGISNEAGIPLL